MRIAYTHRGFCTQDYGGVTRYFTELAARLAQRDDCEVSVLAMAHRNRHLRDGGGDHVTGVYIPAVPKTGRLRRALNDWLTRRRFSKPPAPDIVHETYFARRKLAPPGSKTVLTVFDMTHERFPDAFRADDRTRDDKAAAVAQADHIICISEATRRDLVELLGVDQAKTSVVHLGSSFNPVPTRRSGPHATLPLKGSESLGPLFRVGTYLLFVGDRGGYKNFRGLVQAMRTSPALRGFHLVCFGGGAFRRGEELPAHVTHLSGGDDVLAQLYANAAALVYPSLYEGFGLPLLEAMACGCPVASSNRSSLPEVAGDAAELFDPAEPAQIAAAIERVLSPARAAELRRLGLERVKRFTWERCAHETYTIYRSLVV